jgi:2'-5' RNA ligase
VDNSTASPIIDEEARYTSNLDMQKPRYALVAYVEGSLREFVKELRRELHPDLPHLAAHVTILPPRCLSGSETSALQTIERVCAHAESFEIELGGVETFIPTTPTVHIRVAEGASHLCELHTRLSIEALAFNEEWPYTPHLTIVKMAAEAPAHAAFQLATERWAQYGGSRRILLDMLTFVREDGQNCWLDLAPVPLGHKLISR